MNVLSLFDGMSCGMIALKELGIKVDSYWSCEIDKFANQLSDYLFPEIKRLGNINDWLLWDMQHHLPQFDVLFCGFPCQGFSIAGNRLNFDDPRSKLFFEALKIMRFYKPKYFLFENVDSMRKDIVQKISELIGVEPIMINSSLVSAQNRKRLYWTNIPGIEQPDDKRILLKDIIEDGAIDRDKSHCIDANYFKGGNLKQYFEKHRRQLVFSKDVLCHVGNADIKGNDSIKRVYSPEGKSPTLTTMQGGHQEPKISYKDGWRKLIVRECARLQTIPEYIIDKMLSSRVSNSQLYKMLGNGWTVKVIEHILRGIK